MVASAKSAPAYAFARESLSAVDEADRFAPLDLLMTSSELTSVLRQALEGNDAVDAFLAAAALSQVTEDYLHRSVFGADRLIRRLQGGGRRLPYAFTGAVSWTIGAAYRARRLVPSEHAANVWQRELNSLVDLLAACLARRSLGLEASADPIPFRFERVSDRPSGGSGLGQAVLRLPSCFRSMDQRPEDCHYLAKKVLEEMRPRRSDPLLVVGLRTSGSYLAPLLAAYLRAENCTDVRWMTFRPGQRSLPGETGRIRQAGRDGITVLLIDDPPRTGSSLVKAAETFQRLGVQRDRIVMLLPLFGPMGSAPDSLRSYRRVELPWSEWSIHDQLAPEAIRDALREMLCGKTMRVAEGDGLHPFLVGDVRRVQKSDLDPNPDQRQPRTRTRGCYAAELVNADTGKTVLHHVSVGGAGYGYFGRHELAVGRRLAGEVPEVLGFRNGLLFLTRVAGERSAQKWSAGIAPRMVQYVSTRQLSLAVDTDRTMLMTGRGPVWQRFSDLLAKNLGRDRLLARPFLHRGARSVLRSPSPTVVDGFMALQNWRVRGDRMVKDHFADAAFSSQDLFSYDPLFDLSAAAVQAGSDDYSGGRRLASSIREAYRDANRSDIDPERWLANLIVNALFERDRWVERLPRVEAVARLDSLNRLIAAFHAEYLGDALLADLDPPRSGSLCAIDLDGVLETGQHGYPASTPAGVLALRALTRHGYRPVLVTGRSLSEVKERCAAYRLAGGVAEYGGWAYDARLGRAERLVGDSQFDALARLKSSLARSGASIDPNYTAVVRAYQFSETGGRQGLPRFLSESAIHEAHLEGQVTAMTGIAQTDFVSVELNKAVGVRALASMLEIDHQPPLTLAIGDTSADIPMLNLASRRWGPRNAQDAIRAAGAQIARRPEQAGLSEAVRTLIRHVPGKCSLCTPHHRSHATDFVLSALAARDAKGFAKLGRVLHLAGAARAMR